MSNLLIKITLRFLDILTHNKIFIFQGIQNKETEDQLEHMATVIVIG